MRLWASARHGAHFSSPPPPLHPPGVSGHDEAQEGTDLRMTLHLGNHTACRLSIGCPMEEALELHDWLMNRAGPQPSSNSQYPASGSRWPESESRTSPTLLLVQVRFRKGRAGPEPYFFAATVRSLTAKAAPTRGKDMQVIVTNMQARATQGSRARRAGLLSKRQFPTKSTNKCCHRALYRCRALWPSSCYLASIDPQPLEV
jgi:hypothetical protein